MAKKSSSNKYGISSVSFGQPGFSLAAPKVSLVAAKEDEKAAPKADKKPAKKAGGSTPKNNLRGTQQKAHNKVIARKPTMMKKAGRSK